MKKRSRVLDVVSVIRVGSLTTWSRKESCMMVSSWLHCVLFETCGVVHSSSQLMFARLKSPSNQGWAPLSVGMRFNVACRCCKYSGSVLICCVYLGFYHLHMLFTFSALISSIYWCSSVSHQQILMVRHVAPAEIIGTANAAPVSTPMISKHFTNQTILYDLRHWFQRETVLLMLNGELSKKYAVKKTSRFNSIRF